MRSYLRATALSILLGLTSTAAVAAAEPKTWYVYCEGYGHGMHWAVFSENFWPHPGSDTYGKQVGSAAEAFFERQHNLALTGCSGVNFFDTASAQYSRERTVDLHRKMGDRVYFFPLPGSIIPE